MTRSNTDTSIIQILIIASVIFGIIAITFSLDYAFGQTQNITSPSSSSSSSLSSAPNPQELEQVVEEVPAIVEQVDANATTNTLIGTAVTALSGYAATKFLKDRKDKSNVEEYSSQTDKIIFNHVMDNYNDFANLCKIRRRYLTLLADPSNVGKPEVDLLNTIADSVTKKTYMQIEAEYLDNIIGWNVEYYGSPSTDPSITCPDPKNKIARTMTDIKKLSVQNTTHANTDTAL